MKPIRLSLAASLLAALASSASAQFWSLGAGVTAYDASGDGTRVVGYAGGTNFAWTATGGLQAIGGVAPPDAGGHPSISDDGATVVAAAQNAAGKNELARYSFATGAWTTLGSLGADSDADASSGWGVSADGSTAVGLGWINGGTAHAIVAKNGAVTDLGAAMPDRSSRANDVSGDGRVVVGWQEAEDGYWEGKVWKDGVQTDLKDGDGYALSEANVVSKDGTWVAGIGNGNAGGEFWRWSEATGYQALGGPLSGTDTSTAFTAMNGDATAMIGYSRGFGPPRFGHGVLWTADMGVVDLTAYVASQGIDTGGVTLALPLGLSADGRTIVGVGSNGQGFVVRLGQPVPEPGTLAVLGLGAAAALRCRRRQR